MSSVTSQSEEMSSVSSDSNASVMNELRQELRLKQIANIAAKTTEGAVGGGGTTAVGGSPKNETQFDTQEEPEEPEEDTNMQSPPQEETTIHDGAAIAQLARNYEDILPEHKVYRNEKTVSMRRKSNGKHQVGYWDHQGDMQIRTRTGSVLDASLFMVIEDHGVQGREADGGVASPEISPASLTSVAPANKKRKTDNHGDGGDGSKNDDDSDDDYNTRTKKQKKEGGGGRKA